MLVTQERKVLFAQLSKSGLGCGNLRATMVLGVSALIINGFDSGH